MSEDIKDSIRRLNEEAWNKGNLDVLDDSYSADYVQHNPNFPDIESLEALKEQIVDSRKAFPDLHLSIDEIIIEGDKVAARWTFQGTHTGQSAILPIPPTGKQVTITGSTITHLAEGKAVESWFYPDNLGFLQQLGVVPPLEE